MELHYKKVKAFWLFLSGCVLKVVLWLTKSRFRSAAPFSNQFTSKHKKIKNTCDEVRFVWCVLLMSVHKIPLNDTTDKNWPHTHTTGYETVSDEWSTQVARAKKNRSKMKDKRALPVQREHDLHIYESIPMYSFYQQGHKLNVVMDECDFSDTAKIDR